MLDDFKNLTRSRDDAMIFGVASALAQATNSPVWFVRLMFILSTVLFFGWPLAIYVALWIVIPLSKDSPSSDHVTSGPQGDVSDLPVIDATLSEAPKSQATSTEKSKE